MLHDKIWKICKSLKIVSAQSICDSWGITNNKLHEFLFSTEFRLHHLSIVCGFWHISMISAKIPDVVYLSTFFFAGTIAIIKPQISHFDVYFYPNYIYFILFLVFSISIDRYSKKTSTNVRAQGIRERKSHVTDRFRYQSKLFWLLFQSVPSD